MSLLHAVKDAWPMSQATAAPLPMAWCCQVLVMEPDFVLSRVIGRMIQASGGNPAVTNSTDEAIRLLSERSFDLLIVDTPLYATTTAVAATARLTQPGIVIAVSVGPTGLGSPCSPEADVVLQKPYGLSTIRDLLAPFTTD